MKGVYNTAYTILPHIVIIFYYCMYETLSYQHSSYFDLTILNETKINCCSSLETFAGHMYLGTVCLQSNTKTLRVCVENQLK